jgi:hypothetical protein
MTLHRHANMHIALYDEIGEIAVGHSLGPLDEATGQTPFGPNALKPRNVNTIAESLRRHDRSPIRSDRAQSGAVLRRKPPLRLRRWRSKNLRRIDDTWMLHEISAPGGRLNDKPKKSVATEIPGEGCRRVRSVDSALGDRLGEGG